MRILLLLLLLSFSLSTTSSHLSRIVTDLSILSRITNAIALQHSALRRTLNIGDVISELAQDPEIMMEAIMLLNVPESSANTQKALEKIQGLPELVAEHQSLQTFNQTMIFLKDTLEDLKDLEKFQNSSYIQPFVQVLSENTSQFLPEICEESVFKLIEDLHNYVISSHKDSDNTQKTFLGDYKLRYPEIIRCFKNATKYDEKFQQHPMAGAQKHHNLIATIGKSLLGWNAHFPSFAGISKTMEKALKDLEASKDLKNLKEPSGLINMRLFYKMGKKTRSEWYLLGFPGGAKDLLKVPKDIKNPWFQKKIARGKSTGELEKALEPFNKVAKKLAKVSEAWKRLTQMNITTVWNTTTYLSYVVEYLKPRKTQGNHSTSFSGCMDQEPTLADQNLIRNFKKNYEEAVKAFDYVTISLEKAKRVDPADFTKFEALSTQIAEQIPEDDDYDLNTIKRNINAIPGIQKFFPILKAMDEMSEAHKKVQTTFKTMVDDPEFIPENFNLQPTINAIKMLDFLVCLNSSNFKPDSLLQDAKFLITLETLKKDKGLQYTKKYVDNVGTVKKYVEEVKSLVEKMGGSRKPQETTTKSPRLVRPKRASPSPILAFNDSMNYVIHIVKGLKVLGRMDKAMEHRTTIENSTKYHENVMKFIKQNYVASEREFWKNAPKLIENMFQELQTLETFAEKVENSGIFEVKEIFEKAQKVHGAPEMAAIFNHLPEDLRKESGDPEFLEAIENSQKIKDLNLDFASGHKNLNNAGNSLGNLMTDFDEIFGLKPKPPPYQPVFNKPSFPVWVVVGMCFGFFAFCILLGFVVYGFTKNGRRKYRNLWLYYFPSQEEFERRWRYSLFMDRENGKNALVDASREVNHINVKHILERGAYVNVYSEFGNTPLHMATQRGFFKVVELLIKAGADRTLLNAQNKTSEQMIPLNYKENKKEEAGNYEKIEKIYEKYKDKKFRIRVPQVFPTHLFQIFIEKRTEDHLTNMFTEKFRGITSDEPLPTTTHCICKTTDNGILETDDLDLLTWIFQGAIIVKESWMSDCMENEKLIRKDAQYLVEHVKYHGTLYENCVLPWSRAMAKGEMPYLLGVYVVIVMKVCPQLTTYTTLINTLGGHLLSQFPSKDSFNLGSHPYLHNHLGPLWIIHDGQNDLNAYQNDQDRMFSLFTEEEFFSFLLRREIHQETNMNPISQLSTTETEGR